LTGILGADDEAGRRVYAPKKEQHLLYDLFGLEANIRPCRLCAKSGHFIIQRLGRRRRGLAAASWTENRPSLGSLSQKGWATLGLEWEILTPRSLPADVGDYRQAAAEDRDRRSHHIAGLSRNPEETYGVDGVWQRQHVLDVAILDDLVCLIESASPGWLQFGGHGASDA